MSRRPTIGFAAALATLALLPAVHAAIDNIVEVVKQSDAADANSLGGFVYVEKADSAGNVTKAIYTSTFGSGGSFRRVDNIDGSTAATVVANEGDVRGFYNNGDPTRGITTPLVFGMVLNPAKSAIYLTDGETTKLPGATGNDLAASKRLYRYDFGAIPTGGDGRSIFTSLATQADFQTAAGTTSTINVSRQAAFSPTGNSIYVVDSGSGSSGVYRVDPTSGAVTRVLNAASTAISANKETSTQINTEPTVTRVGNLDRVYFRGYQQTSAGTNYNVGGIDYVDTDGTAAGTGGPQVFLSAAKLADFLQVTGGTTDVRATAIDAAGTFYFYDQTTARLIAMDAQGRLFKLASRNERDLALTASITTSPTPTGSVLRLQTRTVTNATAGRITQLMYAESTPLNSIAGINVFKPTDFDRNGVENGADLAAFAGVITSKGVAASLDNARYDLNGNGSIDGKDVQIAQAFQGFKDGDTDFSFTVNFADLLTLSQHYGQTTGQKWTTGDFTYDDQVNYADLALLARNYTGGPLTADQIVAVGPTVAADFAQAIPEPAMLAVVGGLAVTLVRRRRQR